MLRNLLKTAGLLENISQEKPPKQGIAVCGREKEGWLDSEHINNFPCEDLRTIEQLWVKYSNGRFGFSVQKQIYQSLVCQYQRMDTQKQVQETSANFDIFMFQ